MTPPTRPGWGILGAGRIAELFTSDLRRADCVIAAVASRDRTTGERFAAAHDIPAVHDDYRRLVEDPRVDIVYIATPTSHHEEHAMLAIAHGKHVLIEKPFTLDAASAQRVLAAADEAGVVAMEAMWTRFLPHMEFVRRRVADGAIGRPLSILVDLDQRLTPEAAPRLYDPALGGGSLLDLGVYPVSFGWDLFGAPSDVAARALHAPSGVDIRTSGVLGWSDGRHLLFQSALDAGSPNRALVIGDDGWLELSRFWYMPTTVRRMDSRNTVLEEFDGSVDGRGMQFEALEMERLVIERGRPEVMSAEHTVGVMITLDLIRSRTETQEETACVPS